MVNDQIINHLTSDLYIIALANDTSINKKKHLSQDAFLDFFRFNSNSIL